MMIRSWNKTKYRLGSFALPGLCFFALALALAAPPHEVVAQPVPDDAGAYSQISAELVDEEKILFDAFYGTLTAKGRAVVERMTALLDEGQRGSFGMLLTYAGTEPANDFLALFASLDGEDFDYATSEMRNRDYRNWSAILTLLEVEDVKDVRSEFLWDQDSQCYAVIDENNGAGEVFDLELPADAKQCSEATLQFRQNYTNSVGYVIEGVHAGQGEAKWQAQLSLFGASTRASHTAAARNYQRRQFGKALNDWEINHLCGAVYIGKRFLLTAAHCIGGLADGRFFPGRRVRLGSQRIDGLHNLMEIRSVVTHANYDGATFRNDIALIELKENPTFDQVAAAKLPPQAGYRPPMSRPLLLTGWGFQQATKRADDVFGLDGEYQDRAVPLLLKGELKLLPNSDCGAVDGELCAGTPTGSGTSCRGDSGGPLADKSTGVLIGLVSHGNGCGLADKPVTYVDVAYYLDWIKRAKTKARSTGTNTKTTLQ
jgi:hypothetical protein